MKKHSSLASFLLFLSLFHCGCQTPSNGVTNAGATLESREERIMITWFKYHGDLVESIRCSADSDKLRYNAEEAILVRQGIVRDLSIYSYEEKMTKEETDMWYEKLRIAVGTENIAYVDAYHRLTGKTTSPPGH
jgi:hypothetical protein